MRKYKCQRYPPVRNRSLELLNGSQAYFPTSSDIYKIASLVCKHALLYCFPAVVTTDDINSPFNLLTITITHAIIATTNTRTPLNNMSMERPKRPLSSFNLFYRYKRALILERAGEDPSKEQVLKILCSLAGLEDGPPLLLATTTYQQPPSTDEINSLRRTRIREALRGKILPMNNKRRRHRKAANSVGISFSEMGKLMTTCWKGVDPFGKKVFEELSEEGRHIYRVQMDEYNKLNPPKKSTPDDNTPKVKGNNDGVKKESKSKAAPPPAPVPATLPAAAAISRAQLPQGLSIPMQMMVQSRIAAFQRKPPMPMAPLSTTNRPYFMAVAQYNALMASRSKVPSYHRMIELTKEAKPFCRVAPPHNRVSEAKVEAKSLRRADFNMNILATAATVAAAQKRDLPLDIQSLPLKKRFKR